MAINIKCKIFLTKSILTGGVNLNLQLNFYHIKYIRYSLLMLFYERLHYLITVFKKLE